MQEQYKNRIVYLENELEEINRRVRIFSWLRLALFVLLVILVFYYVKWGYPAWILLLLIGSTAGFLYIIRRHSDIKYAQSVQEALIKINKNEISVLAGAPSFMADGEAFHREYSYTRDLDIFGPQSLYHLINRCFSLPGQKKLARWLSNPTYDKELIWRRQKANISLRDMVDVRQEFLAHGLVNFSENTRRFIPEKELIAPRTFQNIQRLRWVPPAIFILFLILAGVLGNTSFILYGFLANLIITGAYLKTTMNVLQKADSTLKNLRNYHHPLEVLVRHNFTNLLLSEKKKTLEMVARELRTLQQRLQLLESRSNIFVGIVLNGLMGYDFFAITYLENWFQQHVRQIPVWLDEIAFFETMFSLSNFAYNNPAYIMPDLSREFGISGKNIRHPFIPEQENVGNDFSFEEPLRAVLLTGSNMSGKSTFLRSLGVNQVLAMASSVVAADELHTGMYEIFTSFRKSDSIQERTSLFYDELKKLRFIITELRKTKLPALILLDEILRGTNSDDKYYGSRKVMLKFKEELAMTMLATHDIALSSLEEENGEQIQNYCFESQIINGELHFDYKLQKGVAVNKNATFLMEKMGII